MMSDTPGSGLMVKSIAQSPSANVPKRAVNACHQVNLAPFESGYLLLKTRHGTTTSKLPLGRLPTVNHLMSFGMFLMASTQLATVIWPAGFPQYSEASTPAPRVEGAEFFVAGVKVQLGSDGVILGVNAMESALSANDVLNRGLLVAPRIELLGTSVPPFASDNEILCVSCRCARCSIDLAETKSRSSMER